MAGKYSGMVVAARSGMYLHDKPVIKAHPCHFSQHLAPEQICLIGAAAAGKCPCIEGCRLIARQIGSARRCMPVIGGGGPEGPEIGPAAAMRCQIACPA